VVTAFNPGLSPSANPAYTPTDQPQYDGGGLPQSLPTDIANLVLWLDAADASTITDLLGVVSQWDDKSTNGFDVEQLEGGRQPTTGTQTVNGLNVLDFTDDSMSGSTHLIDIDGGEDFTIFTIGQSDVTGTVNSVVSQWTSSNPARQFRIIDGTSGVWTSRFREFPGGNVNLNSTVSSLSLAISTLIYDASSKDGEYLVNNQLGDAETLSGTIGDNATLVVGGIGDSTSPNWDGIIAEIVAYNRILPLDEQTQIFNYLNRKWGGVPI